MEGWPVNIICYALKAEQYDYAQEVLPSDRGFSTEIAWSDRFLGRLLNCHPFDVLALIEPINPADVALCWQARRHSRCNTDIPLVILGGDLPQGLSKLIKRTKRMSHIPLPAEPRVVQTALLNAMLADEGPATQPAMQTARQVKSNGFDFMPTALSRLFEAPSAPGLRQPV